MRSAIVSGLMPESATLHRRHHFHPRARGKLRVPLRARQYRPVDRDRDASLAESPCAPAASPTEMPSSTSTSSSLTVRFTPVLLPEVPRRCARPSTAPTGIPTGRARWPPACARRVVRRSACCPGSSGAARPAHSASSYSPSAGITAQASSSSSRTPVTDGAVSRPCSYCVAPTTTPSARGTRYTGRPCTRARTTRCGNGIQPLPPPQPQHLALDRPDLQTGPQRGRVDTVGDHHGVDAVASVLDPLDGARPANTELLAMGFQRLDELAVVHRQFVGSHGIRAEYLGPEGVRCPGRQWSWPPDDPARSASRRPCADRRHRRGPPRRPATRARSPRRRASRRGTRCATAAATPGRSAAAAPRPASLRCAGRSMPAGRPTTRRPSRRVRCTRTDRPACAARRATARPMTPPPMTASDSS